MDRRTILAVVLSLAIWWGWLLIRPPEPPPPETDGAVADATDAASPAPSPTPSPASAIPEPPPGTRPVPFTMCGATGTLSTDGGRLRALTLSDHRAPFQTTPLYTWIFGRITGGIEGPWQPYGGDPGPAVLLSDEARALATGTGPLSTVVPMALVSDGPGELTLRGTGPDGIEIQQRLAEHRDPETDVCWVDVEVTWRNPTDRAFDGELWVSMADHTPKAGSRYQAQRQPMALVDGSVVYGGQQGRGCLRHGTTLDDEVRRVPLPGPVEWFGLSDRYFGSFLVPRDGPETEGTLRLERLGDGDRTVDGAVLAWTGLGAGAARTERFLLYLGPNQDRLLTAVHPSLGRAIDLGWFAVFGYPLLWLLRFFYSLVGNWGVAIILLTFLVKLIFFPMTQKSFKSMQGMQKIQPELQAIKEKYADDPQEMNRRTLELMQAHGVNPLSGCLPMVVQMPVWFALYNVLLTSVELYHTRFLYLKDLTEPDPFLILPVSITLLMWLQQRLSTPAAGMDPVQQQVMRWMPLIFGLMFFAFPSGLAVYVFVNMTLSILQQWVIKRSAGPPPTPAVAAG